MNILWVPHTSRTRAGVKSRGAYFIERVARKHTVHEICWDVPIRRSATGLASTLRVWRRAADGVTFHHLPRVPSLPGPLGRLAQYVLKNAPCEVWLIRRPAPREVPA